MNRTIERSTWTALVDEGFELDPAYSGRGMFGDRCVGVTGRLGTMLRFVAVLVSYEEDASAAADLVDDLAEAASSDSMGTDSIYYFPGLTVEE